MDLIASLAIEAGFTGDGWVYQMGQCCLRIRSPWGVSTVSTGCGFLGDRRNWGSLGGFCVWNIGGFTPQLRKIVHYSEKLSSASNVDVKIQNDMPEGIEPNVLQYITQSIMSELDLFKSVDRLGNELAASCQAYGTCSSCIWK